MKDSRTPERAASHAAPISKIPLLFNVLDLIIFGFRRCQCPRDPLCVHAAPHLPEVGPFHQATAFQGLSLRQPKDFSHAELCRANKLPEICPVNHWFGFSSASRAAGTSESPLSRRADPTRGGGQLEVR